MKTKQQLLADAQKQAEGLQSSLVSSVKSGDIEGVVKPGNRVGNKAVGSVGETYDPDASATRINSFSAALNVAIDQARQQRKDKTMDFMNGVVPAGALPATSFAGVLSAFSSDSAPLESSLISSASNFAQGQEEAKMKMAEDTAKMLEDSKNSIRELALAVGKAGGKQETINAITTLVNSGDIDAAIKIGASALAGDGISQVGSNLVRVNDDGTVEVIYSGGKNSSNDSSQNTVPENGVSLSNVNFVTAKMTDVKLEAQKILPRDFYTKLVVELNDEQLRSFLDDWVYEQNTNQQSINPVEKFTGWKLQNGVGKKETVAKTEKVDSMSDEALLGIPSK